MREDRVLPQKFDGSARLGGCLRGCGGKRRLCDLARSRRDGGRAWLSPRGELEMVWAVYANTVVWDVDTRVGFEHGSLAFHLDINDYLGPELLQNGGLLHETLGPRIDVPVLENFAWSRHSGMVRKERMNNVEAK